MLFYILLIYQIRNCLLLVIDCQCFLTEKYFDKNCSQPGNFRICLKFYRLKFVSNLRFTGAISAGFALLVKSKFYE